MVLTSLNEAAGRALEASMKSTARQRHAAVAAAIAQAAALIACRSDPAPTPQQVTAAATAAPLPCSSPHVRVVGPAEAPADTTLVMLHGYGATSADIEPIARALGRASPRLVVLVPDGCEPAESTPGGRQWWGLRGVPEGDRGARLAAAASRVSRFVDAELRSRGLPSDRVAWAGFSQGAMLAEWMAVHGAPAPLAVVSFSGRFDDDSPVGPAPMARATPVLLVHGERDAVIPFAEAGRAERALTARGAKVERLDRPAMGHAVDSESLAAAVAFLGRNLGAR